MVGANVVVAENVGELFRQTADVWEANTDLARRGIVIGFCFWAAFGRFEDPLFVTLLETKDTRGNRDQDRMPNPQP